MKLLLITLLTFSSSFALALELGLSGSATTRYRNETSKNRAQQRVILKFDVKFNGDISLIGVGTNGTSFNGGYDSFYDSSKDDEFDGGENIIKNFKLRKLYFEKQFETDLVIQAGAIPTDKNLTSITALEGTGWIDGVRALKGTKLGDVRITAGSLNDPDETNMFQRDRDLNYFEINVTREVYENMLVELGYERHDNENYLTIAAQQKLTLASDKIVTFVGEALINVDETAIKASVGIKGDFIQLLTNRKSGITFEIRTNYSDENIGERGTTYTSGFKTSEGHYGTVEAKFNINKKKNLSGYCRYRKNYDSKVDDERFECGVTKKYK